MDDKCKKYESLFVFRSSEELNSHIESCEDCKLEDEKMKKVSSLIQEVKSHYIAKKQIMMRVKAACVLFIFIFAGAGFGLVNLNTDISDKLKYGTTLSAEDLGLPVDSYGLIMVE